MRRKVIAGNWKMNGLKENMNEISPMIQLSKKIKTDVILFPPVTLISSIISKATGSPLSIGAQNCHQNDEGSHTGDVSPKMLRNLGAEYVIIGHSERREAYKETDELLKKKMLLAWKYELSTILCVGENSDIAKQSKTNEHIARQLHGSLPTDISEKKLIIAYEPIWAIGTGRVPTAKQIESVHYAIRSLLCSKYGTNVGNEISIIYGGSLNKDNSSEIFNVKNVDGGLVGGASLFSKSFLPIIQALESATYKR